MLGFNALDIAATVVLFFFGEIALSRLSSVCMSGTGPTNRRKRSYAGAVERK
jgi:hypothetical protein